MKKYTIVFLTLLSFAFSACSVEEEQGDPDLLSEWKLMEVLQSSGGPSVYQPAEVEETVTFYVDSKVKRSVSWCSNHNYTTAEYSEEENLILIGCEDDSNHLRYRIKGNFLFIYPNCIETCALKYRRIDHLR